MSNEIDRVFQDRKKIKLMTHVVAGYPDLETSKKIIFSMVKCGVDMVEIQIPFSDPLADGPTIMGANQKALDNNITPENCFGLIRKVKKKVNVPLLFMTYANIVFRFGIKRFISESESCGISGLIIPDLPFDENNENFVEIINESNLYPIWVVSSDIKISRLKKILKRVRGFIYVTLRIGITGPANQVDPEGLQFIKTIKQFTSIPVAAGFGISSPDHIKILKNKVDMAIIGSHIINIFNTNGLNKVEEFVKSCGDFSV
jgi:tryptophan synthase alpha chain